MDRDRSHRRRHSRIKASLLARCLSQVRSRYRAVLAAFAKRERRFLVFEYRGSRGGKRDALRKGGTEGKKGKEGGKQPRIRSRKTRGSSREFSPRTRVGITARTASCAPRASLAIFSSAFLPPRGRLSCLPACRLEKKMGEREKGCRARWRNQKSSDACQGFLSRIRHTSRRHRTAAGFSRMHLRRVSMPNREEKRGI